MNVDQTITAVVHTLVTVPMGEPVSVRSFATREALETEVIDRAVAQVKDQDLDNPEFATQLAELLTDRDVASALRILRSDGEVTVDLDTVQVEQSPVVSPQGGNQAMIGKTVATVTETPMRGVDTYKEAVTWTEVRITFTDGTSITHSLGNDEVYDVEPDVDYCNGCGREELTCSLHPCEDVIEDREATMPDDDEDTACRDCGERNDNGEGSDGYCGNCADRHTCPGCDEEEADDRRADKLCGGCVQEVRGASETAADEFAAHVSGPDVCVECVSNGTDDTRDDNRCTGCGTHIDRAFRTQ